MIRKYLLLIAAVCAVALVGGSCGEEQGQSENRAAGAKKPGGSQRDLLDIAKEALGEAVLDDEFPEGRQIVEGGGFVVKTYDNFPAEEVAKKGRVLVYTDRRGKQSGGVLYVKKIGAEVAPAWHWYFEDMVPDSVVPKEINGDGLWDVRIVFTRGKVLSFVQEESFTLFAKERSDWIAMNGTSSPPPSEEFGMWRAFDGDTTTAWKSSLADGAFVEFLVPFGVKEGILSVCALAEEQPRQCVVYADGKRVGEVTVQPTAGRQMFALGESVKGAKKIKLEFPSTHGGSSVVAVAELGFK